MGLREKAAALPFVLTTDENTFLWQVTQTGDWSKDNEIGRGYADALLLFMRENHAPQYLPIIVAAMKEIHGIEVGFFHRLAERAIA